MMRNILVCFAFFLVTSAGLAQENPQMVLTDTDYARAERFLGNHTSPLVVGGTVRANWLPDDRMWYRSTTSEGSTFMVVDPSTGVRTPAFDHARLAQGLGQVAQTTYDPLQLPFFAFSYGEGGVAFEVGGKSYTCDLSDYRCVEGEAVARRQGSRNTIVSPDGTQGAFIRDNNLWVRDMATGQETQLTTDGEQDFGYATNNAGWTKSDRPVLIWSPDSKKIATFQHDGRGVGEMYLVSTNVGHPRLEAWKYPLPGDSLIFRIERVVIHVDDARVVRLQMPPDPHRSTICDHVACRGQWADVEWSPDSEHLAFVSSSRDHKEATLRIANPHTGTVRTVMGETVDTFFESGYRMVNWHVLHSRNEVLWFSQRDDWGHLYRYDLQTGQLIGRVTEGAWNVLQVLRVDEAAGTLYFLGAGREHVDPYFQYLYRVNLDGSGFQLLTPENANHTVQLAPSGAYFVDTYSTPTVPPVAVMRDDEGKVVVHLERADISRLEATGWQPPTPIQVKARDGETDIFGLMYKPTHFDPSKTYPIINYLYPGPQSGSVGSRSFSPSRGDKQAIAELGFIVVEVDAMGTPMRSKSFHEAYYGNMGDNGLPDQMAAIRQLAARHTWMDLDRVGIYGHSGGGFASTDAILRYPDFYKVAVSGAGNHDNRSYEDDWGEKWQGLLETYPDGTTNYDNQANQLLAENLKGKLLLAHGTMDSNVPPYNTMLVVNALIAANKDFDLLLLPNRGHGFSREPYMMRRRWDYFVRHLLGAEPPKEFTFGRSSM